MMMIASSWLRKEMMMMIAFIILNEVV